MVLFNVVITSEEPSFTWTPLVSIKDSDLSENSRLYYSSSLVSVGMASGMTRTLGAFLGITLLVWLLIGKFKVGYSSGRSFPFAAETKWLLKTLVFTFTGKLVWPILYTHIFNNFLFVNEKPKYESSVSVVTPRYSTAMNHPLQRTDSLSSSHSAFQNCVLPLCHIYQLPNYLLWKRAIDSFIMNDALIQYSTLANKLLWISLKLSWQKYSML